MKNRANGVLPDGPAAGRGHTGGFTVQARLERAAYPAEVDTRRAYPLAGRPL